MSSEPLDLDAEPDLPAAPPPRPRFVKPAWAQTFNSINLTKDGDGMFSRSKDTFQELLDEDLLGAPGNSGSGRTALASSALPPSARPLPSVTVVRRRTGHDGEDEFVGEFTVGAGASRVSKRSTTEVLFGEEEPDRLGPPSKRVRVSSLQRSPSSLGHSVGDAIALDSDDDSEGLLSHSSLSIPSHNPLSFSAAAQPSRQKLLGVSDSEVPPTDDLDESDEELREIRARIRKSRQQQQQLQQQQQMLLQSESSETSGISRSDSVTTNGCYVSGASAPADGSNTAAAGNNNQTSTASDGIVDILITSTIPGTESLIIRRRLDQRLQEVREHWLEAQDLPPHVQGAVILTYKLRRVFDIQKCSSLDIPALRERNGKAGVAASVAGAGEKEDLDFGLTEDGHYRIRMQAMTRQEYDELRAKEARKRLGEELDDDDDDGNDEGKADDGKASAGDLSSTAAGSDSNTKASSPKPPAASEGNVRLILRSRDFPELKLIVKPDTKIEELTDAFSSRNNLTVERAASVRIVLDGEALPADSTIEDADVEDMDTLEVHYAASAEAQAAAAAAKKAREDATVTLDDDDDGGDHEDDGFVFESRFSAIRNGHMTAWTRGGGRGRGSTARGGARGRGRGRGWWSRARG